MQIKPKKRLGQNFLIDRNIQKKIIAACELRNQDTVLEIGAGRGELTTLIAERANQIYALELDTSLCEILKDHLREYQNIKIIKKDILKFNLRRYFSRREISLPRKAAAVKVIGNIPYYIASPIIEHLLKYRKIIESIFITVQKEFAQRIVASSGCKDYGSLSCFVQYYTKAKILFSIKKTCFRPIPKVDSCFLRLEIRDKPAMKVKNERLVFKIMRAAFNQRRKTLRNSLKGLVSPEKLETFFGNYSIDPNIRPERLSLEDFVHLTNLEKEENPEKKD